MHRWISTWSLVLAVAGCSRSTPASDHQPPASSERPKIEPVSAPDDALTDVIQLEANNDYTCALRADGKVYCWGEWPVIEVFQPRPRMVPGIEHAREIEIGSSSFAVEQSGEIVTWGWSTGPSYRYEPAVEDGGPGASRTDNLAEPLDPSFSAEAAAAAYPDEVELVVHEGLRGYRPDPPQQRNTARAIRTRLQTDGTIFLAGEMLCTQAKGGALTCVDALFTSAFPSWHLSQSRHEPDIVGMVASHMQEVCILKQDGSVQCIRFPDGDYEDWGTREFKVVDVALPGPAAALGGGWCGTVVLKAGRLVTWCDLNEDDTLSATTTIHPGIDNAVAIDASNSQMCVLHRDERITCWWQNTWYEKIYGPSPLTTRLDHPTQLAVGSRHACALLADGHVQCWGVNNRGQLGNGVIADAERSNGPDEEPDDPRTFPTDPPTFVVAPTDEPRP